MVSWDNESNIPLEEQAPTIHQDTATAVAAVKELPQAEVLPPPPESPQAAKAKEKTKPRKKRTAKKPTEPTAAPTPFGFA